MRLLLYAWRRWLRARRGGLDRRGGRPCRNVKRRLACWIDNALEIEGQRVIESDIQLIDDRAHVVSGRRAPHLFDAMLGFGVDLGEHDRD